VAQPSNHPESEFALPDHERPSRQRGGERIRDRAIVPFVLFPYRLAVLEFTARYLKIHPWNWSRIIKITCGLATEPLALALPIASIATM